MKKWKIVFLVGVALMPLYAHGTAENYSNTEFSIFT